MFFKFNPINIFKKIISDNKNNINNMIMYLTYNVIYYITGVQVLYNKSYKTIEPFLLFLNSYTRKQSSQTDINDIQIIADGNVTITTNKEQLKNILYKDVNFDLIIYSHLKNKVIYVKLPTDYNYNILNYKFMNTELITKSQKRINLSFVTTDYNYFIENNFINSDFILYFIDAHYKEFMSTLPPGDLNEYTMHIIDDKINIIEITSLDTIWLVKDKFVII